MAQRKKGPTLEPVPEHHAALTMATLPTQATVMYKPHKYERGGKSVCARPLNVLAKLRNRYEKAMNKLAAADFTAMASANVAGIGSDQFRYARN